MGFWATLVQNLPKIRTRIQLAGLLIAVAGYVTISLVVPGQVAAPLAAGAIGVSFLIFGSVLQQLEHFPAERRAGFIITLFIIFCVFVLGLAALTAYFIFGREPVPFNLKVRNLDRLDLERDGTPSSLSIAAGRETLFLTPDKQGKGIVMLPRGTNEFEVISALWRGFELKSPRNTPIAIGKPGIMLEFSESEAYIDRLETSEVKRLAKRFLGATTDEEMNHLLGLKPLPKKRQRTAQLQECAVEIRNESGEAIIPTVFDCDEFVWAKDRPFNISSANIGTRIIGRRHTAQIAAAFSTMSAYNRVFAVLISWQNRLGTRNWYRLAGFIEVEPHLAQNRPFLLDIVGDAENVSIKKDENRPGVRVIR